MNDVEHTEEIRKALENRGVMVNDINIKGMKSHGPTRVSIDGQLKPRYTPGYGDAEHQNAPKDEYGDPEGI
jgi:hypothetical protein